MIDVEAEVIGHPGLSPDHNADDATVRAARWVAYLYSGHATEQGRRHFSTWLRENDAHPIAYRAAEQWWRDVDHLAVTDAEEIISASTSLSPTVTDDNAKEHAPSRKIWRYALPGVAAILAMGIVLSAYLTAPPAVTETRYATGIGEIRVAALKDGTRITLSGGSILISRLSSDSRSAELVDGQAYFDVAHDPARPFVVNVAKTRVSVLGTEFEIRKAGNGVRVSVAKGLVSVKPANTQADTARYLRRGYQILASLNGKLGPIGTFDVDRTLSWRRGRLEYVGAPLADILADVNRYRTERIALRDRRLGSMKVTTSMSIHETDRLLAALEATGEVRVIPTKEGVTVMAR